MTPFHTLIAIARGIHIFFGVIWAGFGIVLAGLLLPALGPDGGRILAPFMVRRGAAIAAISASLTVLSGIYLFGTLHAHDASAMGITLGIGGLTAIAAWLVGLTVIRPTVEKLGRLQAAGGASTLDPAALQRRMKGAGQAVSILLVVSVLCMAIARYV